MKDPVHGQARPRPTTAEERRYVEWFRGSAPYINAHRGRTFVIQFGGESLLDAGFPGLVHDIALLESLGVRLVLVHGARPQIEARLAAQGLAIRYAGRHRLTDEASLPAVKEAAGSARLEIEALLSMGLANSPMSGARIRVASGNFVTARPMGIRDGVDFRYTGEVRGVDVQAIARNLEAGVIVLLSPLGFSPTGEVFNLNAEDVATAVAVALGAHKLILMGEGTVLRAPGGGKVRQLTLAEARALLERIEDQRCEESGVGKPAVVKRAVAADEAVAHLGSAIRACGHGVRRTHLLERGVDGALLLELFTRDGVGTMVSADPYDRTRRAGIDDVGGILELIEPLEAEGRLVRRSRRQLETEIDRFLVMERDGTVIACAACFAYPEAGLAELACLAVHRDYENGGRGDQLLEAVETAARQEGATRLFALTTHALHWFRERGFMVAEPATLPLERRALYNWQRNSKVLIKDL